MERLHNVTKTEANNFRKSNSPLPCKPSFLYLCEFLRAKFPHDSEMTPHDEIYNDFLPSFHLKSWIAASR